MKTLYVDVLITVNIFVDFFLLLCTKRFLHINTRLLRMILGSSVGGICSLCALLPRLGFGLNILLDICFAVIIVFVTFGKAGLKEFLKRVVVYFSVSFFFCGIMIFIYTAFKPNGMEIYNDVVYFNISPILLIILTLICYYIMRIIKRFTKNEVASSICTVKAELDSKEYCFCAKIDTGCTAKEPFSGAWVIIADKSLIDGFCEDESKSRIVPFKSLGGDGILRSYRADKIFIDDIEIKECVYIGICKDVLKGDVRALVPYGIINC